MANSRFTPEQRDNIRKAGEAGMSDEDIIEKFFLHARDEIEKMKAKNLLCQWRYRENWNTPAALQRKAIMASAKKKVRALPNGVGVHAHKELPSADEAIAEQIARYGENGVLKTLALLNSKLDEVVKYPELIGFIEDVGQLATVGKTMHVLSGRDKLEGPSQGGINWGASHGDIPACRVIEAED